MLREPATRDVGALVDLLSIGDASTFGIDLVNEASVRQLIDRFARERAAGSAFGYVMTLQASGAIAGLIYVRQLDPMFEAAECDCTVAPSSRGAGVFLEASRLVTSFAFTVVGAHRIEARVNTHNGRANGALRKLGAVQEGVLRRSVRRGSEYVDQALWSVLKDDWSDQWTSSGSRIH
jgi:RimJ/RimL family protein N-acetyltransferase